ncbi:MAG TPA: hypothetical protein PLV52_02530, partial [Candidatus Omnitrophota bacterium]|nr:hypothetical protein [Candidatus Omnitrophota bacterium]
CNGVFIDKSMLTDKTIDIREVADNISLDAVQILVSNSTLKELQTVLALLEPTLREMERYNVDKAFRDSKPEGYGTTLAAKVQPLFMRATIQMKERKSVIASTYNGMAMPSAISQPAVIATTEKVAEQDPFFADNMKKAKDLGVKNVFIYGDRIASADEAKAFVRAAGYEDVSDIVFIDKRNLSYEGVISRIAGETGVGAANIGVRSAKDEMGVPAGDSKFLEVQPYAKDGNIIKMRDGTEVLLTMNTYQVLLAIVTKPGAVSAEEFGIPGLKIDGNKFIYLPPAEPRDIAADYEAYRTMVVLISSAA